MPFKCCVPYCNGNYQCGPKVSVYSFPKNESVVQKWLEKIQRKDFCPNKNSRVCELHFTEMDFETMAYAQDYKTGRVVSAPLKFKRVKENAVPSIFPNSPPCSSSKEQLPRKRPKNKKTKKKITDSESELEALAEYQDDKTGKVKSKPVKIRILKEIAVPSIIQNSPISSISEGQCRRRSQRTKKKKEMTDLDSNFETLADGHDDKTGKGTSVPVKIRRLKEKASDISNSVPCSLSERKCSKKCPEIGTKKKRKVTHSDSDFETLADDNHDDKTEKVISIPVKKKLKGNAVLSVSPNSHSSKLSEGRCTKKCLEVPKKNQRTPQKKKMIDSDSDFEIFDDFPDVMVDSHNDKTGKVISMPVKTRLKEESLSSIFPTSSPGNLSKGQRSGKYLGHKKTKKKKQMIDLDSDFADGHDDMADGHDYMIDGHDKTGKVISTPVKIKLKEKAVTSIIPNSSPCSLSIGDCSREFPEDKNTKKKKEIADLEKRISSIISAFEKCNEPRKVSSLIDIKKCIEDFGISKFWTSYNDDNSSSLFLLHIESNPEPFIQYSVKINCNMDLTVSAEKCPVGKLMNYSFPIKIQHFDDLEKILNHIERNLKQKNGHDRIKFVTDLIVDLLDSIRTDEYENVIKFIQEQFVLLLSSKNCFRYSTDFLIFSCILKNISFPAYNFIRQSGNIILPHPDALREICNDLQVSPQLELDNENFLMYIASRLNFLSEHEKTVTLLIDEINIKPNFDYQGEINSGPTSDTTSAYVFMVSSIISPFKEVAYILPVNSINFEILHNVTKKIIVGLENLDLKVICVVTNKNSINDKAMSLFTEQSRESFVYPHPIDQSRPLFFLIDCVCNLKNIRNDWLNQKNYDSCFLYPDFDDPKNSHLKTASFMALKKISEIESNGIVSYATGLTLESIAPTNLERQNTELVFKIFNKFVIEALIALGPKHNVPHFEDTAMFIDIICKWWYIFNVKTSKKEIDEKNMFMEPINGDECDEKYVFLNKFLLWLDAWQNINDDSGALSKETHTALVQTTNGMLELIQYCIDECKMKYILTGKFQIDSLEIRFGKYKQIGGSQYPVSVKQLLECENKLRLKSCVKLELRFNFTIVPLTCFDDDSCDNISVNDSDIKFKDLPNVNIDKAKVDSVKAFLPVVTYLGGFCIHNIIKKLKCDYCKENLVLNLDVNLDESYNLMKDLDSGGLKCPTQFVVTVVMFNYIVIDSLYSRLKSLRKIRKQKQVAVMVTFNILKSRELYLDRKCLNNHSGDYVCKLLLSVSTNILLKNFRDNLKKEKQKEQEKISKKM